MRKHQNIENPPINAKNIKIEQPVHVAPASFEYLSLVAVACAQKLSDASNIIVIAIVVIIVLKVIFIFQCSSSR